MGQVQFEKEIFKYLTDDLESAHGLSAYKTSTSLFSGENILKVRFVHKLLTD